MEEAIVKSTDRSTKVQLQLLLDSERKQVKKRKHLKFLIGLTSLILTGIAVYFLIIPNLKSPKSGVKLAAPSSNSTSTAYETSRSIETTSESTSLTESGETKTSYKEIVQPFPYQVPVSELHNKTFSYNQSINLPTSVTLNFQNEMIGTAEFLTILPDGTSDTTIFEMTYLLIPTQTKRAFDNSGSLGIKTVHVNTELVFGQIIRDDFGREEQLSMYDSLYLYYNKEGGLSLLTPNYAGNVPTEKELDIMIELND